MQSRAYLLELEKVLKLFKPKPLVANIGFDAAENGPSKVWVTGIPVIQLSVLVNRYGISVYRYKHDQQRYILH